jgi:hypothetical protein
LVIGETLPADKLQIFLSVFSELPQRVLWKMDKNISLPNVKTSRWLPQFEILSKLYMYVSPQKLSYSNPPTSDAASSWRPVVPVPPESRGVVIFMIKLF